MTESPKLIVSQDLGEFFGDELSSARDNLGVDVSDNVEHYLVTLLCEYTRNGAAPAPGLPSHGASMRSRARSMVDQVSFAGRPPPPWGMSNRAPAKLFPWATNRAARQSEEWNMNSRTALA